VYFLYRSRPARNEYQPLKNATRGAARSKQTTDDVPNKLTAHRDTPDGDGLRNPASDSRIDGGHVVPPPPVFPEIKYCDNTVSHYEERDEGFFRQLLPLLNNLKNAIYFPFQLFFPATLDNGPNNPRSDGVPNKLTAHHVTFNDDGLRTSASDEYIEGGHDFPFLDVRLEMGSDNGDFVAHYKERF